MFKRIRYGKPIYNLELILELGWLPKQKLTLNDIETYGVAIHKFQKFMGKPVYISDKGYLLEGYKHKLKTVKGKMEVGDRLFELIKINNILEKKKHSNDTKTSLHIHREGGLPLYIGVRKKKLYLF